MSHEQVYDERTFRFFLAMERTRATRSDRSLPLVLVDLSMEAQAVIGPALSKRLFALLGMSVREVDVIGWYRSDLVAGALLTQGRGPGPSEVLHEIGQRISHALCDGLPLKVGSRINVRVIDLRTCSGHGI